MSIPLMWTQNLESLSLRQEQPMIPGSRTFKHLIKIPTAQTK